MLRLPSALQNNCRSYLSLKDMHVSRAVCKAWKDIHNIPKYVVWESMVCVRRDSDDESEESDESNLTVIDALPIPPEAICKNIVKLIYHDDADSISEIYPDNAHALNRILNESHSSLKHIQIWGYIPNCITIPRFENLSYISLSLFESGKCLEMLENMPNLEHLAIAYNETEIQVDMRKFPRMKEITLRYEKDIPTVQNLQYSGIQKVEIEVGVHIDASFTFTHLSLLLSIKPNVLVYYRWVVLLSTPGCSSVVIGFTIHRNVMKISRFCPSVTRKFHTINHKKTVSNLKKLLQELRKIRSFQITLDGLSFSRTHLLKYMLSRTQLFTESEINAM